MQEVLARTEGQDGHGTLVSVLGGSHLGVVEQVVALLPGEAHVDAEPVSRPSAAGPQDLLRRLHRLGRQQRSAKEVAGWESRE